MTVNGTGWRRTVGLGAVAVALVGVGPVGRALVAQAPAKPSAPVAASAPAPVVADSVWLRGIVTDTLGNPVANAVVLVEPDGTGTRTNADGVFALRVAAGPSTLVVRSIGYGALRYEITLVGGEDVRFEIALASVAVVLDAFRVESRRPYLPPGAPAYLDDFYRRRARGMGRTFTREELERYGGPRGALSTVPGVRPQVGGGLRLSGVTMTRCSGEFAGMGVVYYVDGMRMREAPDFPDADIVAIEVYRGPSQLPPEVIGDGCGAVFIWLRRS